MTTLSGLLTERFATGRAWFESQLAQTERLRPMLAGGGVVLFLGLLLVAVGVARDSTAALRAEQGELDRLRQQISEGSWAQRKQQSETMKFQLAQRFWTAETAGLAEASLERWLRERIERQGVRPDSIRVQRAAVSANTGATATSALTGVQRMTAKVIMPFEPEALVEVLNAAATSDKILVIDRLLMRAGRNPLIEMDVSTFVSLSEAAR